VPSLPLLSLIITGRRDGAFAPSSSFVSPKQRKQTDVIYITANTAGMACREENHVGAYGLHLNTDVSTCAAIKHTCNCEMNATIVQFEHQRINQCCSVGLNKNTTRENRSDAS